MYFSHTMKALGSSFYQIDLAVTFEQIVCCKQQQKTKKKFLENNKFQIFLWKNVFYMGIIPIGYVGIVWVLLLYLSQQYISSEKQSFVEVKQWRTGHSFQSLTQYKQSLPFHNASCPRVMFEGLDNPFLFFTNSWVAVEESKKRTKK